MSDADREAWIEELTEECWNAIPVDLDMRETKEGIRAAIVEALRKANVRFESEEGKP